MIINNEEKKKQKPRYQVNLKLDFEKDSDLVEVLEKVEKKQTFIKEAIREYLKLFGWCDMM